MWQLGKYISSNSVYEESANIDSRVSDFAFTTFNMLNFFSEHLTTFAVDIHKVSEKIKSFYLQ